MAGVGAVDRGRVRNAAEQLVHDTGRVGVCGVHDDLALCGGGSSTLETTELEQPNHANRGGEQHDDRERAPDRSSPGGRSCSIRTHDQIVWDCDQRKPVQLVHFHRQGDDTIAALGAALHVNADAVGGVWAEFAHDVLEQRQLGWVFCGFVVDVHEGSTIALRRGSRHGPTATVGAYGRVG